ncbi:hypothetical protein HanOQP8_Chr09g0318831 [Helianthus annuus]|nr:hypothetical protein HanOQP8_Chr09g0318831 [Helianthus annuus]
MVLVTKFEILSYIFRGPIKDGLCWTGTFLTCMAIFFSKFPIYLCKPCVDPTCNGDIMTSLSFKGCLSIKSIIDFPPILKSILF